MGTPGGSFSSKNPASYKQGWSQSYKEEEDESDESKKKGEERG